MECGGKCLVVTLTHSDYYFCVWWWSHLHGDWLPHVLISSNVQSDHKWEHWVTLWQHFFMTTRAELGREHQPAIFSWSTDSDGEHKTRPGWQLSGEGKGSHFSAFLLKTLIHFPKPRDFLLKSHSWVWFARISWYKCNHWVWPGGVEVGRVMLVCLSLFSLTVVTCVKSPNAKVTRKCFQWSLSRSCRQVGPSRDVFNKILLLVGSQAELGDVLQSDNVC